MKLTSKPVKNMPMESGRNIPLALLVQGVAMCGGKDGRQRRYTKALEMETLTVNKYKSNGKGITYKDLLSNKLATRKGQAQTTLKHCLKNNVLFTLGNYKPQQYYPTCLKAEILKKNIPIGLTGANYSNIGLLQCKPPASLSRNLDPVIMQTLEGYVLPLLPKAPLHIHKMQLKVNLPPECYQEIVLTASPSNGGKQHEEIIGRTHVRYHFYANGTVMVFTESSNKPFSLEDELDLSRLVAFFGQVRDRLVVFLADKHERIVPDIMQWQLTQCDINKDIVAGEWLQVTGLKIQIKHLDHLFRVYIKSIGRNTVCRTEESCNFANRPAIEAINDIFNHHDKNGRRPVKLESYFGCEDA